MVFEILCLIHGTPQNIYALPSVYIPSDSNPLGPNSMAHDLEALPDENYVLINEYLTCLRNEQYKVEISKKVFKQWLPVSQAFCLFYDQSQTLYGLHHLPYLPELPIVSFGILITLYYYLEL